MDSADVDSINLALLVLRTGIGAVMLAQAVDVEPDLIGQLDFLEQIFQPLRRAHRLAGHRVGGQFGERRNAEFKAFGQ